MYKTLFNSGCAYFKIRLAVYEPAAQVTDVSKNDCQQLNI